MPKIELNTEQAYAHSICFSGVGVKMTIANTHDVLHKVTFTLYLTFLAIIGIYCVLNATYNVMLGGTPFYFFAIVVLIIQACFALTESEYSRHFAGLGLIVLTVGLLYTYGLDFASHYKAFVIIPSIVLTLFGLPAIYKYHNKLVILKAILLVSVIILAAVQFYDLHLLKDYYASLPLLARG